MRTLRRNALDKLAELSAKTPASSAPGPSDLVRLCKRCPKVNVNGFENSSDASRVPMGLSELEVLLAVCKAAPLVRDPITAEQLLTQLSPYLPESYLQTFATSPVLRGLDPSPWEALSHSLTSALLALGNNHPKLRARVSSTFDRYIQGWAHLAKGMSAEEFERDTDATDAQLSRMVVLSISMIGFLEASAKRARFWSGNEILRLVGALRMALDERFMIALETALSVIRSGRSFWASREWKRYTKHYAAAGRPLGAMLLQKGFMELVVASAGLMVAKPEDIIQGRDLLDSLGERDGLTFVPMIGSDQALVEGLVDIAADEIRLIEEGSDFFRLGSAWQQRLSSAVKGSAFVTYLCCSIIDNEVADPETLVNWIETTLNDPVLISDDALATTVLKTMAVLAKSAPATASSLSRMLPRLIVQGGLNSSVSSTAAESLASILKLLTQDAVITTLYSLGNVLTSGTSDNRASAIPPPGVDSMVNSKSSNGNLSQDPAGSAISLAPADMEEPFAVYACVIQTVVGVAISCKDDKITALAQSMLIQKIGRVDKSVDAMIVTESGLLGVLSAPGELRSLLKLYGKVCHDALRQDDHVMLDAVRKGRSHLSRGIKRRSPLYEVYMEHLLDAIISKGDTQEKGGKHLPDVELGAQEIGQLLGPLSILVYENRDDYHHNIEEVEEKLLPLQRNAWFNLVVHGFTLASPLGVKFTKQLQILAKASRPLIADDRADQFESDVELNTVLRRGKTPEHTVDQKRKLIQTLPNNENDIKTLSYPEVVFLNAAHLVENLRASAGDCNKSLHYFLDSKMRTGSMASCMVAIAQSAVNTYLARTLRGDDYSFSAPFVARQLAAFFAGCCHRISRVQDVAIACADDIIQRVPSALCQQTSLFALLELLTIMWGSCIERDTDEYDWTARFTSSRENVSVELSDNYDFRQLTLINFHKRARDWVIRVLNISPLDIKGLLQSYLAEFDDEGVYGHVALGRSFALEMGSVVPSTDQRLGAIERPGEIGMDTASDFMAQYSTRQEYRYVDGVNDPDQDWLRFGNDHDPLGRKAKFDMSVEDAATLLADVESRTLKNKHVSVAELRDVLRRAAALLCRVKKDHCAIVHHLVGVPFAVFSKQSIKLGISLWMSVIKENPRMESRILVEVAENWEATVRKKMGLFNERFRHPDPFFVKMEFAPSDKNALMKKQQQAYNLLAPHFRLLHFLSSHFNATRLSSPHLQRTYHRLLHITLDAMRHNTNNPLARETHFHIILLGFKVLQYSTHLDRSVQWRLKDSLITAALAWFRNPPRWSFGGNRIQIKAETHLLLDVQVALHNASNLGVTTEASLQKLQGKQDLLNLLLSSELTRLMVWLFPLDHDKRNHFANGQHHRLPTDPLLSGLLKVAWDEDPQLAVQLVSRFQQSHRLASEVRALILKDPELVLDEPDALEIMLGSSLPNDVTWQLKYLQFWAPTNPITAATYFLPAYGNHPFIIQYAMRALESHSVDVTFFYVPQIVQGLRYDVLGYVERYIIETAKFSQLFAHQIIWNMEANMYKDEESQIPDPIKPTLDKVKDTLIASFDNKDRQFYNREFTFFNEVTGISGKLRPFIKKPKPEKKQKIEEELRQIQVDVGVYLPSNPDGVVIGIDRKSGKPLQSHAKAPYMATFRIRKERKTASNSSTPAQSTTDLDKLGKDTETYEIWQSAIFKVGDDCRQDVLALQMIAAFRGIFNNVGLDVFVFPYRVTATAPGCGVIDVLPNSISRDMLGREAVNGLYDYFTSKYGGEDSVRFQEARNNFVKSNAAYSVISYLLQMKDRHNGNIMVDDAGHILHIDFGFCFDIAPGGVRFERAPFKLTNEMIAVMGGSMESQSYRWFEELCVKAFLAARMHTEHLVHIVVMMLDSGLPCFKPETIQHFRERFVLEKNEREAADYMRGLIKKSAGNKSTYGYDQFQLMTNGIPF